jgi:hypothetical protein
MPYQTGATIPLASAELGRRGVTQNDPEQTSIGTYLLPNAVGNTRL